MALNIGVTDPKAELDGVWVDYPLNPDIKLKIARFMNAHHEKTLKRLRKPYTTYNKSPSDEQERKIFIESIAEAILLDWKGIEEDGKQIKYSKDEAVRIMSMDEARDFRDFIASVSAEMETFRKERVAESGKP